jgi:hypothetical protein
MRFAGFKTWWKLKMAAERFPEVKFHALREHASAVG